MTDKNYSAPWGIATDKDYIEQYGLSPSLEGKEGINDAIKEAVLNEIATEVAKENPHLSPERVMRKARSIQAKNMR